VADEVSLSIDQQLRTVAESVCMVSALYTKKLIDSGIPTTTSKQDTIFRHEESYRDYNFHQSCRYPACPKDYGSLLHRSRFTETSVVRDGSTKHSSVYLYSSQLNLHAQNDSEWDRILNLNRDNGHGVEVLVNLPYQDIDFDVMYNQGPNSTVMFYLSTTIHYPGDKGDYSVAHRTFPGTMRSQMMDRVHDLLSSIQCTYIGIIKKATHYDPTGRPWYVNSSISSYNLFGPYVETFTGQFVINLSTRNSTTLKESGAHVDIVSASIFLLESLFDIIDSVHYANGGFGALMKYDTNEVLVWRNRKDIYNQTTNEPYDVSHFDAELATHDLKRKAIIDYKDSEGTEWIVTTTPLFNTSYRDSEGSNYALVLLIFSRKLLAMKSLHLLLEHTDSTTTNVISRTMTTIAITAAAVMIVVFLIILYIVKPFEVMKNISKEIIRLSTVEDELRDYSTLIDDAYFNQTRTDEVGLLSADYYDIVCLRNIMTLGILKGKICQSTHPIRSI